MDMAQVTIIWLGVPFLAQPDYYSERKFRFNTLQTLGGFNARRKHSTEEHQPHNL